MLHETEPAGSELTDHRPFPPHDNLEAGIAAWHDGRVQRKIFGAAYLGSSAAALIAEISWTRMLVPVVGGSAVSVAVTLAGFLGGLGLGALLASRASRRPVAGRFAAWQLASAGACWIPMLLQWVGHWHLPVSLAVIMLCALPFGTAFPLAARLRAQDGSKAGPGFGVLYALDTLGALAGVLAGCVGIYLAGIAACLAVAASLKVVCAVVAFLLAPANREAPAGESCGQAPPAGEGDSSAARPPAAHPGARVSLEAWWLAGVAGFCLLGAENLWSRLLSFVVFHGSSSLSFSGMLACVLGCTALGAVASRGVRPERFAVGCAAILAGAALATSLGILGLFGGAAPGAPGLRDMLAVLLATGPASFFSGMLFSLLCSAFSHAEANRPAGRLLFANLSGAVLGSLAVGLFAVPWAGLSMTLVSLSLLLCLSGLGVLLRLSRSRAAALAALGAGAALAFSLAAPHHWTAHLGKPLFYREGRSATVAVVENPPGVRRLFIDGVAVAGTDLLMQADQKTLAHLPLLLHPAPRRALTIGFGSGQTSASMLLHPHVTVDALEISPEVAAAAAHFEDLNGGLPRAAPERFHLHLADARTWLRATGQSFDVIVNDCTDLAYKSDASLYTEEFFRLIRSRLAPGGIGAAWLPLRADRPFRVTRAVVAAFLKAFPQGELWVFDSLPLHYGILVGGEGPIAVDVGRLEVALKDQKIAADLAPVGLADPHRLAISRYAGPERLADFVRGSPVHRDGRPSAEFFAAFERGGDESACEVMEEIGWSVPGPHLESASKSSLHSVGVRLSQQPFLVSGHCAFFRHDLDLARIFYMRALQIDPFDEVPRTLLGIESGVHGTGGKTGEATEERLGTIRLMEGRPDAAIELFSETEPGSWPRPIQKIGLAFSLIYKDMQDAFVLGPRGLSPMVFQVLQRVEREIVPRTELTHRVEVARWLALLPAWLRWAVLSLTFAGL